MTTEQKIKEAYEQVCHDAAMPKRTHGYIMFKAGYLSLLNGLEPTGSYAVSHVVGNTKHMTPTYILPEGITKC